MINSEFWQNIASAWCKREKIEIPDVLDSPDVPDDYINLEEVEDWDDLLKELLNPDSDEMDLTDLLSD